MKRILLAACLWGATLVGMPTGVYGWTVPRRLTYNASSDPQAAVADSNIYVVEWRPGPDFNFVSSPNNGHSWTDPVQPADTFYGESSTPDIEYTPNGLIHVVWIGQYEGLFRLQLFHQSSSDAGRHWSNRHRVFNSGTIYGGYPRLASKGDTLFVAFGLDDNLAVFRSFNSGVTWRDSTVVDSSNYITLPPLILYSEGRLHLIFMLGSSDVGCKIYYSRCDDLGLTWSPRINLSTYQPNPPYYDSVSPWAYADESGHVVAMWLDYRYGFSCNGTADVLGRISTDNGDTWFLETRLTNTQTAEAPNCLIVNDTVFVAWPDAQPLGCNYRKLLLSSSGDWGSSWTQPEVIAGNSHYTELFPFLFYTRDQGETFIHCLYGRDVPPNGTSTFYIRNKLFYSNHMPIPGNQPVVLNIKAYPNVFNSSTIISFDNSEGGDAQIEIFNILGQGVWAKNLRGKEGSVIWDARDTDGNSVSSGVYFAVARNENHVATIKIIYLK